MLIALTERERHMAEWIAYHSAGGGDSGVIGENFAGLTNFWRLDEHARTRFDRKGRLNLTETVTTEWKLASADFKTTPTGLLQTAAFSLDAPFSFSVWIYPQATTASQLFSKSDSGVSGGGIYIEFSGGNIVVSVGQDGDSVTAAPTLNIWNNLVFTVTTGALVSVYLNGSLANYAVNGPTLSDGPLYVGKKNPTVFGDVGPVAFPGLVNDLMLFNKVLTAAQVTTLWNRGIH